MRAEFEMKKEASSHNVDLADGEFVSANAVRPADHERVGRETLDELGNGASPCDRWWVVFAGPPTEFVAGFEGENGRI